MGTDIYPQQYVYYPTQYQPMYWQGIMGGLMGLMMVIALGAWAVSLVKKAFKGEEVEYPL